MSFARRVCDKFFIQKHYALPFLDVTVDCSGLGPGAKQSFKEECDINRIMFKYQKSGTVTWLNSREPTYRDVSGGDFRTAMDLVVKANESFAALPSSVRTRFHNDAGEFLAFMDDKSNLDEAIKLGLVTVRPAPVEPEPVKVRVVVDPLDRVVPGKA